MPTYEQLLLYINIGFLAVIAFAVLVGLARGFKKSLYVLVTMAAFYVLFFVSIDLVANQLYGMQLDFLGGLLANLDPAFSSVDSIEQLVVVALQTYGGETLDLTTLSPELLAFVTGLGIFVLKIVYTILYFSVGFIVWKLVFGIIRMIFFGSKKGASKNPLLGGVIGAANGVMAVFVSLIMLGGIVSIAESVVTLAAPLLAEEDPNNLFAAPDRDQIYEASYQIIELSSLPEGDLDASMQVLVDFVQAYNDSIFVQTANLIVVPEISGADVDIPLHLYLFDSVISFPYDEEQISLRHELSIFASIGGVLLTSDYADTNDLSDITGDQIRDVFTLLSRSVIVVKAIPVAIEFAVDYFDVEYDIDMAELQTIDWAAELETLGVTMSTVFDIISQAGLLEEDPTMETIDVDGDLIRDLFGSLGDSQLMLIAVDVFLVPMIEDPEGELHLLITVPDDLDWAVEFEAIGELIAAILDADITIAELQEGSFPEIINALSQIDFTLLLDSQLVSNMMINVLSGQAGIEGLDILIIPSDIVWEDVLDEFGAVQTPGELRNILNAVNAIIEAAGDLDLTNLGLSTISNFTDDAIDALFASRILAATVSDLLLSQDLGGTTLVVPSAVFDIDPALVNGIIHEAELSALVKAVKLLATQIACDPDDTECDPDSFDVTKVLTMEEADIDLLLDSQIIAATFGKVIYDLGASFLTIPDSVILSVAVQEGSVDVVSAVEIKAVLNALMLLGLADFENFEFGPNILSSLELIPPVGDPTELDDTKIATLLASGIIHATVSKMIVDLTSGASDFLIVPEQDVLGNDVFSTVSGTEYVSKDELSALLKAFYALDVADFNELSSFSVASVLSKIDVLLDSAILHATFSKQIIDLDGTISVPYNNAVGILMRITTGTIPNQTEYILASELELFIEAIEVFGIGDLSGFGGGIDLSMLAVEANRDAILASAILHKTISDQLFDVEGSALIIPVNNEAGFSVQYVAGVAPHEETYITATEIDALLVALDAMGFNDLTSFSGSIDSASFFSDPDAILASAILQATISDQLLNSTGGVLQVPNAERVTQGATTYIKKVELLAIIAVLDELGFTAFGSMDFDDPSALFAMDPDVLFASATLQLTVSDTILAIAADETVADGTMTLVVPLSFRESVAVGLSNVDQIELNELKALFTSLDMLGITGFGNAFDAASITSMTSAELTELLGSGSMHVTFDKMIRGNANIASEIPTHAEVDVYGVNDVLSVTEIVAFIEAVKAFGGNNFATITFTFASLTPANRDTALSSMIVRNTFTDEIEAAVTAKNFTIDPFNPTYVIPNTDYMDNSPLTFLTKSGALAALDFINS